MSYNEDISHISTLDLPWSKLSGCNILITGATGLIGGSLVDALMLKPGKDYAIYASGRNETRAKTRFARFADDPDFHFIKYDVIEPLHTDVHFDYIIHAASFASPNAFSTDPVGIMKANFYGTSNLLDYGLRHNMRRMLYISSGEIYGEGDGREFTENYSGYVDCTSPRSCYPSSKRAAETLCVSYAQEYGADVVIARPCHIYGPNFTETDNRVFAQFIRNVRNGEDIVMKSNGRQFRSWCYVADCVSALFHILLKGKKAEAYNIADASSSISIKELAETIAAIGGKKVVMAVPDELEKAGFNVVKKSVFSTNKLESLGWSVTGCMRDKLKAAISE